MGVWYYRSESANQQTLPAYQRAKPADKVTHSASRSAELKKFLAAGHWKKADEKTTEIMLRETNRDILGKLDFLGGHNSMAIFPCETLRAIDALWVKYSQGHFGFSVQQRILQSIFEKRHLADFEEYSEFVIKVGWKKNESEQNFQRIFTREAPQGHLPSFDWMMKTTPSGSIWMQDGVTIFSRVKDCNINTYQLDEIRD